MVVVGKGGISAFAISLLAFDCEAAKLSLSPLPPFQVLGWGEGEVK